MSTARSITGQDDRLAVEGELLDHLLKQEGAEFNSFPLSYAQERIWFLDQLAPGSHLYNVPVAIRLEGKLDALALETAFRRIIDRHEALRTTFMSIGGRPVQVIWPGVDWGLATIDLGHMPRDEREGHARSLARAEARKPFHLTRGPLIRATLVRLDEEDHVLLLTLHHIVSDGWSIGVLFRELKAHLDSMNKSESPRLEELPIQYADYANWQREWLQGEVLEEQLGYWRKQLSGSLPELRLPTDRPRPAAQTFRGARLPLTLSAALSAGLRALSRREGVTLFVTLLSAFKALLHCYTGQRDIVVATSVANRGRAEIENLIGLFINILALRTDLSGDPDFKEVVRRVRDVTLGAYANQDLPFEKIIAELQPDRQASYAPLAQVAFTLLNAPAEDLKFEGLTLSPFKQTDATTAKTDLLLYLVERPDGVIGSFEYSTDVFDPETVERMSERFTALLEAAVADPGVPLSRLRSFVGPEAHPEDAAPQGGSNLTRSQTLYWVGQTLRPDAPLFNMITCFVIETAVDVRRFQNAFQRLVDSSDALRTIIREANGTPAQEVLPEVACSMETVDLSGEADPLAQLDVWLDERRRVVFDLGERLFDSALIKLADDRYAWYINHHQLIGDAWATSLMYRRVSEFYGQSREGSLVGRTELPQFRDYIEHEREYRGSGRFSRLESYWKERLAAPPDPITIYGKAPRHQSARGVRVACALGRERAGRLRELATRKGVFVGTVDLSQFSIFASLLFAYLHRVSGGRRLSLRVMHNNRLTKEFAETIGMFMETLPLRITIEEGETFLSLIRKVAAEAVETFKHGRHTILNPAQDKTLEVAFNYINAPFPPFEGAPVSVKWVHPGDQNEVLNLHVRRRDSSGELVMEFDFDCDAFSDHERRQAIDHFLRMLDAAIEDADCPIDRPSLFLGEEQRRKAMSLEDEASFDFD